MEKKVLKKVADHVNDFCNTNKGQDRNKNIIYGIPCEYYYTSDTHDFIKELRIIQEARSLEVLKKVKPQVF